MMEMDLVDIPSHPMFANDNTKAQAQPYHASDVMPVQFTMQHVIVVIVINCDMGISDNISTQQLNTQIGLQSHPNSMSVGLA